MSRQVRRGQLLNTYIFNLLSKFADFKQMYLIVDEKLWKNIFEKKYLESIELPGGPLFLNGISIVGIKFSLKEFINLENQFPMIIKIEKFAIKENKTLDILDWKQH